MPPLVGGLLLFLGPQPELQPPPSFTGVWPTVCVWLTLFMSSAGIGYAAKDVVITTSGDKLVGEIKKVEKDFLTLSTDYSDSDFKIKWEKIASI